MVEKSSNLSVSLKLLVVLALFVLISSGVNALDFIVDKEDINYRISPDEVAQYNLTFTNLLDTPQVYVLSLKLGDSLGWVSFPSAVSVPAMSSETFILNIAPNPTTSIGVYRLDVSVKSQLSEQIVDVPVHLSYDGLFFDFGPNVETKISLPSMIDPRENAKVVVELRNRNPLNIVDAELRIRSDLFKGEQIINITPGPYLPQDSIIKEFVFQMDPLQSPGEYEVLAQVYYPRTDKVISHSRGTVIVDSYSSTPSRIETSKKLFVVTNTITVENFGNRVATAEVMLAATWFKKLFSKTVPKAEFVSVNGESSFLWNPVLEPTEKKVIMVHTNYWPLVIFIALIVLIIFLYFSLRSPIVMDKEAAVIDEDIGEGSSDIRIRLFVKNRSGGSVKNLIISDKVSGINDYVESTQLGHVKPSRITKTSKKGTMLYWDVDELEAYEERIFTYKVKSKLKVVGDLTLPRSKAKFETRTNKERSVLSSPPFFKKVKKKKSE